MPDRIRNPLHRDLAYRLAGGLLLLAAGGTTLVHRGIYVAARQGPAQALEFALSLATFLLACTGLLLVIHGARLFARRRAVPPPTLTPQARRPSSVMMDRMTAPLTPAGRTLDTRRGVALMQSRRVMAALRAEELGLRAGADHR